MTKSFRQKQSQPLCGNLIDIPFTRVLTNQNRVVYCSLTLFKFFRYFLYLAQMLQEVPNFPISYLEQLETSLIQPHLYQSAKILLYRYILSPKQDNFAEDTIYSCLKNDRGKMLVTRYLVTMMKIEMDQVIYSDLLFDEMRLALQQLPEDQYIKKFVQSWKPNCEFSTIFDFSLVLNDEIGNMATRVVWTDEDLMVNLFEPDLLLKNMKLLPYPPTTGPFLPSKMPIILSIQ